MDASPDATALLIVRVWSEVGAEEPLRFRITQSLDVAGDRTEVTSVATVADLVAVVECWADQFARRCLQP